MLQHIVRKLCKEFAIKDLGALRFFLGVQVRRDDRGLFLTQSQYTEDVLERAGMSNCKPAATPVDVKQKLSAHDDDSAMDATFYRSITGALQYLTLTRPDIAYAVNQACLYMQQPQASHWNLVKRILRYLRGTITDGLQISASPDTELKAYSDADWAGCQTQGDQRQDIVSSSATPLSRGHPSDRQRFRDPALKRNTAVLPMLLLSAAGFTTCFKNFMSPSQRRR